MATQDPFTFADKVATNPILRTQFVGKYIDSLLSSMTPEQIEDRLRVTLQGQYIADIREYGADEIVREVAEGFPQLLSSEYNVDVSLI
jgi:hypothetical protein